jgi:hypothetical protein
VRYSRGASGAADRKGNGSAADAGTAHITYSTSATEHGPAGEHTYTPGADHYCRLVRGASRCANPATFIPPETYRSRPGDVSPFFDNSPGANQDPAEGSVPLATGNSLPILAHRTGNVVAVPGGTSTDVNYLYSSDDGGKTFTGPGIIGTLDYDGGAVAYDAGGITSLGIFGTNSTLISGDIDDPANWSTSSFPGVQPRLAGGPHGAWLTYYPPNITAGGVVVKLVNARRSGPATKVFPPLLGGQDDQLAEASDGRLTAAWEPRNQNDRYLRVLIAASARCTPTSTPAASCAWSTPMTLPAMPRSRSAAFTSTAWRFALIHRTPAS